jgi:molecular chaperone GrpE
VKKKQAFDQHQANEGTNTGGQTASGQNAGGQTAGVQTAGEQTANEPTRLADAVPETEEEADSGTFKFFDRRFWVEEQDGQQDEEPGGGEPSSDKPTYVQQLEKRVDQAESKLAEYVKAYKQQVNVEWEKSKERIEREAEKKRLRDRREMAAEMLDMLDALSLSLDKGRQSRDVESLLTGLEIVYAEFKKKLSKMGLVEIEALGDKFDPQKHEAVSVAPTDDASADGDVIEVYKPGFVQDGQLVRPAMVRVARKQ